MPIFLRNEINGKNYSTIDYGSLITEEAGKTTIILPELYRPVAVNSETLRFCSGDANVLMHGCFSDAVTIVKAWTELEGNEFPLNSICEGVLAIELYGYAKSGLIPQSTHLVEVARMVDAVHACKAIESAEQRMRKLKKNLEGMAESRKNARKMFESIMATTDEFRIAKEMSDSGIRYRFTDDKGPDFKIEGHPAILIDAKSRFNRNYEAAISTKSANISPATLVALLCRDAYGAISDAFDNQGASIALVNLSHSQYGPILSQYAAIYGKKLDMTTAIKEAVELAKNQKRGVVVYSTVSGSTPATTAITVDEEIVRKIGQSADYIEVVSKKNGRQLDFCDLANEIDSNIKFAAEVGDQGGS